MKASYLRLAHLKTLLSDLFDSVLATALLVVVRLRRAVHDRRHVLVEATARRLDRVHQLKKDDIRRSKRFLVIKKLLFDSN